MKSFDTDLKKYTEKIRLRAKERRELRERVLTYMEYHPLPKQKKKVTESIASQSFVMLHFNTLYTRIVGGVFLLFLLVGVPLAAERSVPGDVLYLVKTGINENIQSKLVNSPYEKVAFETKLLERRIAEARLLASKGKLTEDVEAAIAADVKEHADAAQLGLEEIRSTDAEEAAIAEIVFDSTLAVQSAILDAPSDNQATSTTNTIAEAVRAAQKQTSLSRGTTTPSYERLMARIESETTRAYELFENIKAVATDVERTDIERRLADIDRKITGAREASESNSTFAISELMKSLGLTQKLIVFMTDIDVHEHVALETLVPVILTPEERTAAADIVFEDARELQKLVESRVSQIDDIDVLEKVNLGLTEVSFQLSIATSSLQSGDIEKAEGAIVTAYALATDLEQLTAPFASKRPENTENTASTSAALPIQESSIETSNSGSSTAAAAQATSTLQG